MRTCTRVADLRVALAGAPRPVGFVPTLGALHEGHVANLRLCREQCGTSVASIFVNPLQFDEPGDLEAYPRPLDADRELLLAAGVDVCFLPDRDELYPAGFGTVVKVRGPSEAYEGAVRAGHFDGVATVVSKLFHCVAPDRVYFGRKDLQQLAVVRKLVHDLDLDITVVSVATVRDADGVALSSRNARLGAAERERAVGLSRGLFSARAAWDEGERDPARLVEIARDGELDYDYLACVDPESFGPAAPDGPVAVIAAVRIGGTRLIDNVVLSGSES